MPGPDEYFYVGDAGKLNAIYYAPLHKGRSSAVARHEPSYFMINNRLTPRHRIYGELMVTVWAKVWYVWIQNY